MKTNHTLINRQIDIIERVIGEYYHLTPSLNLKSRRKNYVVARQLVCSISRKLIQPKPSTVFLGKRYMKDHVTILKGCKHVEDIAEVDKTFAVIYNSLLQNCQDFICIDNKKSNDIGLRASLEQILRLEDINQMKQYLQFVIIKYSHLLDNDGPGN